MSFGKGGARDNQTNWWWSARSLYGWQLWMGSADWISRKCSLFNEGIPSWRMADQRDSVRFMKFIRNSKRPPTACSTTKRKAEANKRGVSCMYLVVVSVIVIGCHQRYCPTSTASFFASEFRAERGWCAVVLRLMMMMCHRRRYNLQLEATTFRAAHLWWRHQKPWIACLFFPSASFNAPLASYQESSVISDGTSKRKVAAVIARLWLI